MLARLARPASRLALAPGARRMSTAPFAVIVSVKIKPDRVPEFLEVMHADAKGSREEPGCLRFDLLKDEKDPNKFYFYEVHAGKTSCCLTLLEHFSHRSWPQTFLTLLTIS